MERETGSYRDVSSPRPLDENPSIGLCDWKEQAALPTVLKAGPYRFFFYAADRDEPPHVHVERDDCVAKLWLRPVRLQGNVGFRRAELRQIERLVEEHESQLVRAWNDYFEA